MNKEWRIVILNEIVIVLFCSFLYRVMQWTYKTNYAADFISVEKNNDEDCPIDLIITENKTLWLCVQCESLH